MPPRPATRTRERVLADLTVAVDDLVDGGTEYAALTVADICGVAGVSRSTFYVHFRDKGDLLVAMTRDVQAFLVDITRTWWEAPADLTADDLAETIGLLVGAYNAHEGLLRAVMDAAPYDPAVAAAFGELVRQIQVGLEEHVRRGRQAGHIDPRVDPPAAAGWLVCMFQRGLHQLMRGTAPDDVDALTEAVTVFVWRALYAPGTAGRP